MALEDRAWPKKKVLGACWCCVLHTRGLSSQRQRHPPRMKRFLALPRLLDSDGVLQWRPHQESRR
jgi:hypothetical protein